jgi:steroid delta-isomerase-like uncharacterized protein
MIKEVPSYRFIKIFLALSFTASLVIIGCSTSDRESILERNKKLVRSMNREVWNKGNLEIVDELYSPGFVWHFLPAGSETIGLDSLREHVRNHRMAFPDWTEEIRHIVAEGDFVVIHFVSRGTNEGSFLGNPPTGKQVQINEMSIFRIADGKIAEQWLLPDINSLQYQLTHTEKE